LKVVIRHGAEGLSYSNICWSPSIEMRGGKFPKMHPCAADPKPTVFKGSAIPPHDGPLGRFRAKGYFASCFPEGDGIAFEPPEGVTHEQIAADVVECFGFEVSP
jgi:hypothetical protein